MNGVQPFMRRFLTRALLILLVLVGAGLTGYWYWAEQRLAAGFATWEADARARGWHIAHGTPGWGGWPLHARLAIPDLAIAGATLAVPGGIAWDAQGLVLDVDLFAPPYRLSLIPDGPETLRLGHAAPLRIAAEALTASVLLQPGAVPAMDVNGRNVVIMPNGATAKNAVGIGLLQMHGDLPPAQGGKVLHFTASTEAISLPADRRWALGQHMSSLSVEGTLGGLDGLRPANAPSSAALAKSWRDAGGAFEIARLAIGWGPLGLSLRGKAGFDTDLQPDIAAETRIIGYAGTLQALARNGMISPQAAGAASAVLSLLAHTPENGGPSEVDVPLHLQSGHLTVGGVPVAKIPPIMWN